MQTGLRKEQFETDVQTQLNGGWIPIVGTLDSEGPGSGLDSITVNGDWTGSVGVGMRIKINDNGTVKYGIVHALSYSDVLDTTYFNVFFSVSSGTRVRLASTTLSGFYYSREKCPFGFPSDVGSWTLIKDEISGSSTDGSVWFNIDSLTFPVGKWTLGYKVIMFVQSSSQSGMMATLSTANNSESDSSLTSATIAPNPFSVGTGALVGWNVTLSSETTYYLNIKRTSSSVTALQIGGYGASYILGVNAYL